MAGPQASITTSNAPSIYSRHLEPSEIYQDEITGWRGSCTFGMAGNLTTCRRLRRRIQWPSCQLWSCSGAFRPRDLEMVVLIVRSLIAANDQLRLCLDALLASRAVYPRSVGATQCREAMLSCSYSFRPKYRRGSSAECLRASRNMQTSRPSALTAYSRSPFTEERILHSLHLIPCSFRARIQSKIQR